jgi:Thiamine pyrophosphate enzyme, N-terminal TPP binding domain
MAQPAPARVPSDAKTVAEAYLTLLAERGVDYLFANAGTDFAPLIEAFAKAQATGAPAPKPVTAVHENLAVSMAHGYAMVSGRVPAVMVHVSVGTANGVCGIMNAARENVAMLFTAGRSPLTEEGLPGSRDFTIHWAQEMFDQAGQVRGRSSNYRTRSMLRIARPSRKRAMAEASFWTTPMTDTAPGTIGTGLSPNRSMP